jgi:hypothetical protein
MMQKLLLLFFFSASFLAPLKSQQAIVSDPVFIRSDYGYELIGRLRDRILLFRDRYDDYTVQAYDNQMRLSWSKQIEGIDHRSARILGVVPGKNDFSVIYQTRRKGRTQLRAHKYDPGAQLIDSMLVKDYGERVFNLPVLDLARSDDRNCMVVFNTAVRDQIEATCFVLDKMQVVWDLSAPVDDVSDLFDERKPRIALSNNGAFFWVTEKNNRKGKLDRHEFDVLRFGIQGVSRSRIPLGQYLTVDAKFSFDNRNNRLCGAGLWADKNRDRANGVFYLSVEADQSTNGVVRYEPFDDKFLSILRQKDVSDDSRGISDAQIYQILPRQDGGLVMVVERYHEVQRGTSASRGFFRDGMRLIVDYYFDDIFVISFQPNGQAQWKTVLHKKQYSQDDEGTFSSFYLMRTPDRLRILFNDEIKYENTCSAYELSAAGDFDRSSLLNTLNQNLRLRFRDGLQMNATECLIPSEYRGRLKLVLLRF